MEEEKPSETEEIITTNSPFFEPYVRFSKILRTWLVSYGIGSIFFIASQKTVTDALKANTESASVIIFYIILGISAQIIAAFLYKYSMGYLYHGDLYAELQTSRRYKWAVNLADWLWLELLFDIVTIVAYVWATYSLSMLILIKP